MNEGQEEEAALKEGQSVGSVLRAMGLTTVLWDDGNQGSKIPRVTALRQVSAHLVQ